MILFERKNSAEKHEEDTPYHIKVDPESFKSNSCQFLMYEGNKQIGQFNVSLHNLPDGRKTATVHSLMDENKRWKPDIPKEQNKNIGTKLYIQLIKLLKLEGYTLISLDVSVSGMNRSDAVIRIWQKMVEQGLAKEDPPGSKNFFAL